MLAVDGLSAGYGDIRIVRDLTFSVAGGAIVALIGANGAGKTTALSAISGIVRVFAGSISFDGAPITRLKPAEIVARGLVQVPEGKHLFPDMTVLENLQIGAFRARDAARVQPTLERVFALFPRLRERRSQFARSLSGGEQQMVAIGRALMAQPRLLLLDEPSQGLAPIVVDELFRAIEAINADGVTILLVEQNARRTLAVAQHACVIENGVITLSGATAELAENPEVKRSYLGL
jgi:branched-chain amino acid transport system ATP-binding protein